MTAGCGVARSYLGFLLFRIGVGVGEATLSPSAYSLIADSFPKETRATAISVYATGIYIGSGLAGLVFSLAILAIREPSRKGIGAGIEVPLKEAAAWLHANRRTVLHHNVGVAMVSFAAYGAAAWVPSFFIRSYGWDAPTTGIVYGAIMAIFGSAGIVSGGRLADRWLRRGWVDAGMRVCLLGALCSIPFGLMFPLAATPERAALLLAPSIFFLAMPFGVAPAAIQEIMPNCLRSQASAVYLFLVNLIGLGLGPMAVAWCTDYVFHDDQAVRYGLMLVLPMAASIGSLLLASGLPHYRAGIERLKGWRLPAAKPAAQPAA